MARSTNPIEDRYWTKIWSLNREKEVESKVSKVVRAGKMKIFLLAAILLFLFSTPVPCNVEGTIFWISPVEYASLASYYLDGNIQRIYPTVALYYAHYTFVVKWLGFASAFALLYFAFFLSPYDLLKGGDFQKYVQEVVYENPKSPGAFLKKSFKEQKFRWLGFFYAWFVGYLLCSLWENAEWTFIIQLQGRWLSILPSLFPISLILLVVVNIVFLLVFGSARPVSRSGQRLRGLMLAIIAGCLFFAILIGLQNSNLLWDYTTNWKTYSYRYPEDPLSTDPELFVNYNAIFWTLGMVLSSVIGFIFPALGCLYQNRKIRQVIDERYHDVLAERENNWEANFLQERHAKEVKLKVRIRRVAAYELAFFFGLFLFVFWGVYFYMGELVGNNTNKNIAIGVMGFELIWLLFISPVLHYRLEKSILYRGKSKGFVGTEDRGIGSWKKYWVVMDRKNKGSHPPEVVAKSRPLRRVLYFMTGLQILWVCAEGMRERAFIDFFAKTFKIPPNVTIGVFATLYIVLAPLLLLYCLVVLRFPDLRDPERGKKRIYSVLLCTFLAGLVIGSADVFYRFGPQLIYLYQAVSADRALGFTYAIVLIALASFLFMTLIFPFMVRLEDLYESIPDLIVLIVIGTLFLNLWNFFCESLLTTPRLLWSWTNKDPVVLRESFELGGFFTWVGGYWYWGWLQEVLFLGYFCWLLYKITDNQLFNATMTSLLFMMFHWDNVPLMLGTALGGFFWAMWWGKRRNLAILGYMHAFNGALVFSLIPMSMTVGPGAHD